MQIADNIPYSLMLVEDHTAIRQVFSRVIDAEPNLSVVGSVGTVSESLEFLETPGLLLDVVLVDLGLPDGEGHAVIEATHERFPEAAIIVLTASFELELAARAVEAGACGIVHKTAPLEELISAIRRALAGELLIPADDLVSLLRLASEHRARDESLKKTLGSLTRRELELLQCLAEGLDRKAIAEKLHITRDTEHTHASNIFTKLGVHSRLQALVFAIQHGLVEIETIPEVRDTALR